jgi:hypothetical protein
LAAGWEKVNRQGAKDAKTRQGEIADLVVAGLPAGRVGIEGLAAEVSSRG